MATELDLQNQNIKANLAKANLAVNVLHALGLSVNAISVDDALPRITIREGRGCGQLKPGISRYVTRDGQRVVEHEALMSDCKITWEERP